MKRPFTTVIVAVRDEADTIKRCVDALLALDYPAYDAIVVDDASRDRTPDILRGYAGRITVITNAASAGPARARNLAAAAARGELIAFTDGDCIVDRQWLAELVRCFDEHPSTVSAGGAQKLPADATPFERDVFAVFAKTGIVADYTRCADRRACRTVDHNPSCNSIYRKDAYLRAGGFPEDLWPGEDVELDHRLRKTGGEIRFNPDALVYHYRPKTIAAFARMMYRYGYAQGVLVRTYGFFRRIHGVPILAVMGAGMLLMLALSPHVKMLWVGMGIAVACLLAIFDLKAVRLGLFCVGMAAWHAGFLIGVCRKRCRKREYVCG